MGRARLALKAAALARECVALAGKILISAGMRGAPSSLPKLLGISALASAAGVGVGLAFALWAKEGAGIFLALVDGGLSWCF